jgi:hypothetical protein
LCQALDLFALNACLAHTWGLPFGEDVERPQPLCQQSWQDARDHWVLASGREVSGQVGSPPTSGAWGLRVLAAKCAPELSQFGNKV